MLEPAMSSSVLGQREPDERELVFLASPASISHQWDVYRLRLYGRTKPAEAVRGTAAVGLLRVQRVGRNQLCASLRSGHDGRPVLAPLSDVRLVKIDRGGVLLAGVEWDHAHDGEKVARMQFRQTWWCVPR